MDGSWDPKLDKRIRALLARRDTSGSFEQIEIANDLNALAGDELPRFIDELFNYKAARCWDQRVGLILLCGPYAPVSEVAISIGLRAVRDRSKRVRFRALEMLAFSQRKSVARRLGALRLRIPKDSHGQLDAALAAIEAEDPYLFRKSLKLKPSAEIQWKRWARSSAR